jgi:hypothetical protein
MNLDDLKKLAGINEYSGYVKYDVNNPYGGSNISLTGDEKGQLMKKHNIIPGSKEWFQLWFSMPFLTGELPIGKGMR